MAALLLLLKILGFLLLFLVLLVLLLALLPVWVHLKYDGVSFEAKIQVLGLKFSVYPPKKKEKKGHKKTAGEEKPKEKEKQKPSTEEKTKLIASEIFSLAGDAVGILKWTLKALRVEEVQLRFPLQGSDAADTALLYGHVNAFFYSGIAVLQNVVRLKVKNIEIIPDFAGQHKKDLFFACKAGISPVVLLISGYKVYTRLKKAGIL